MSSGLVHDADREEAAAEASGPRWGAPGSTTRRWWILGSSLLALAVALTVWIGWSATRDLVTSRDVGFERQGERSIVLIVDVTRPVGTRVMCTASAVDGTYASVGTRTVSVPASAQQTDRIRVPIRTTVEAATATAQDCRAAD